ncbi:pentapeptide repeat-containing protein [Methyloceanibacter sp.]|uniref:pentapeptide repeat-containing protein n=1 Tax=Methyloceanibacter sp. TaxID=1965321 RepID=UPI003D6D8DF3
MTMPPSPSEDAQELLDEANRASDPAWSSWLAFLLLLTYVVVTLASVSHKNLLLNSPVKLPIINADIPLVGFFQYAPLLFLLVYLSLLVQHVILARKYRRFTDAIAPYEMETGTQHPARERVHSYVFSQIAAGPRPNLITKFMMQLIVYVTFSVLPIITLLYFQIKFLPYHEISITYWHRLAVILGFAMLILLTPLMQNTGPERRRWDIKVGPQAEAWEASGTQVLLVLFLLPLVVGFSWLIATVPNEWIDRRLGFVAPASIRGGADAEAKLLNPLVRRIVYDRLPDDNDKGWWRRWLLSYRVLIVEDTDLGAEEDEKVVLRERNFRFALLSRSDLHRADLSWADLRATQMWKTLAKGKLKDTQLQGAFLQGAQLQGAQLNSAQLQGADLSKAQLQGAELSYANLQGADLRGAELQGADLSSANLQGADLRGTQLQGAKLEGVQLQGADLAAAEIWLVNFPSDLADQSPAPTGLADLKMSPLTPEAQAQLKQDLNASITDPVVLPVVMSRLDEILRNEPPNWDDAKSWTDYAGTAKEPSAEELARFHAGLACADAEGTVANSMALRAKELETEHFGKGYAKAFASALLDENCKGGKALTDETRAALD